MDKKRAWFIAILFFSGLCLTLYPFVSNLIAQSHASQAIAAYDEQVAEMDQEQIDAAKEAVRKYNEQLNAAGRGWNQLPRSGGCGREHWLYRNSEN